MGVAGGGTGIEAIATALEELLEEEEPDSKSFSGGFGTGVEEDDPLRSALLLKGAPGPLKLASLLSLPELDKGSEFFLFARRLPRKI